MKKLWLIGNSGAARECYWLFRDMLEADASFEREYEFGGFLGWRGHEPNLKSLADLYRGQALGRPPEEGDVFAIGIGEPALREDAYLTMKERGALFLTLAHPLTGITETAKIGEANIFQRNSTVFCDSEVGNANYLNGAVNISHDAKIGDANFLGPFTLILGGCKLGSRNLIAARVTMLPHSRVGDDNIIAPGSVVYKGCGNNRRMAGNPALPTPIKAK